MVAIQGRWLFADLHDWYRYLLPRMRHFDGFVWADIQEANNRLEFGAADDATRVSMEQMLQSLQVPCFLAAIEAPVPSGETLGTGQ